MATRSVHGPRIAAESTDAARPAARRDRLAGPALAFSLSGFFVYLGALAAVGVEPRTTLTGAYYGLLGVALVALAWPGRDRVRARIEAGGATARVFLGCAGLLASWFLASAALLSDGTSLSRRLAALLLFWTIPSVLLALSLSRPQLERALWTLAALGLLLVAIDVLALLFDRGGDLGDRFSPIPKLDPITAGQIPALGALALLCLAPRTGRAQAARLGAIFLLAAFTLIPGSRGPLAALAVGAAVVLVLAWRRTGLRVVVALVLGVAVGWTIAGAVGTSSHLTSSQLESTARISSSAIRRKLIEKALRAVPKRPLLGQGVGTLVDDTPEAHRMGIAGRRTYPHNGFVEALYSLGPIGLALYVAALGAVAVALVRLLRDRRDALVEFVIAFVCFAFVGSNLSGELGADAWFWAAAGLAIGVLGGRGPVETGS